MRKVCVCDAEGEYRRTNGQMEMPEMRSQMHTHERFAMRITFYTAHNARLLLRPDEAL